MWDETAQLDIAEVEILLQNGNTHYLDNSILLYQEQVGAILHFFTTYCAISLMTMSVCVLLLLFTNTSKKIYVVYIIRQSW